MTIDQVFALYVAGALATVVCLCAALGRDAGMDRIGQILTTAVVWPIALAIFVPAEIGFWLHDRFAAQGIVTEGGDANAAPVSEAN